MHYSSPNDLIVFGFYPNNRLSARFHRRSKRALVYMTLRSYISQTSTTSLSKATIGYRSNTGASTGPDWQIGADAAGSGRTYTGGSLGTLAVWNLNDIMLRAIVEVPSVGGVVVPTDTLAVLAPYLAMIGLVAVGTTIYFSKRR